MPQINSLREELKEHQNATDTDDNTMLTLVCEFLEDYDYPDGGAHTEDDLVSHVVNALQRLPGDCS